MKVATKLTILSLLMRERAIAHTGIYHSENLGWESWTGQPLVILTLISISLIYTTGWQKMCSSREGRLRLPCWHLYSFIGGVLVVFLALMSPIDAFSDVLGWVHMVQHTLLMMVAAPLFALASPGYVSLWAIPRGIWPKLRKLAFFDHVLRGVRAGRPLAIGLLYTGVLWIWHIPIFYEAALKNEWIHDGQHFAFFLTSYLFWRIVFDPYFRRKLSPAPGILYLFVSSLHAMILGVLMALSPRAWYSWYEITAPQYGFTALQDQQIAGYIMWMPAGITYVLVMITLLTKLIKEPVPEGK